MKSNKPDLIKPNVDVCIWNEMRCVCCGIGKSLYGPKLNCSPCPTGLNSKSIDLDCYKSDLDKKLNSDGLSAEMQLTKHDFM